LPLARHPRQPSHSFSASWLASETKVPRAEHLADHHAIHHLPTGPPRLLGLIRQPVTSSGPSSCRSSSSASSADHRTLRRPRPARCDPIAVLVPADAGPADALLRHLTAAGYDITRVAAEPELARFDRQLTVPPASPLPSSPSSPKLIFKPQGEPGLGGDYDTIRLSRHLRTARRGHRRPPRRQDPTPNPCSPSRRRPAPSPSTQSPPASAASRPPATSSPSPAPW
jgi:hypothetical protein